MQQFACGSRQRQRNETRSRAQDEEGGDFPDKKWMNLFIQTKTLDELLAQASGVEPERY